MTKDHRGPPKGLVVSISGKAPTHFYPRRRKSGFDKMLQSNVVNLSDLVIKRI